jgi:phage protein D
MPNYFAPAFFVRISGQVLTADVSNCVQHIEVTDATDRAATFTITVANPYPGLPWTHGPSADLWFQTGKIVNIALGYEGDTQDMIVGEITAIRPHFPGGGIPTLTVTGKSMMHKLQGSLNSRAFVKKTDKEIVEEIAIALGLEPDVEDAGIRHDYVMQPNHTDMEFILTRAARIHFELLVNGTKLIFRKIRDTGKESCTLVWGHTQEAMSGTNHFPLISFEPTLRGGQMWPEVKLRSWHAETNSMIEGKATTSHEDENAGETKKAGEVWTDAYQRSKEYVRVTGSVASQEEANMRARARLHDHAIRLITGHGTTIGLPLLRAGILVRIDGVGDLFNGLYKITSTTHTLGEGGYGTTFDVERPSAK